VRFDVEAAGHSRVVVVGRDGDQWAVTIDGRRWLASVARANDRWSLLLSEPGRDAPGVARSYDVAFEPGEAGALRVHVDGRVVRAGLQTPAHRLRRPRVASGATAGHVVAPMPGRVVKVLVAPGETVEASQGVVVVEAMKMENELRAPRAGTVREVRVAEGASVDTHTVLVVID